MAFSTGLRGQRGAVRSAHREREQVHVAVVEGGLFGTVVVVLVGGSGLGRIKTEGVGGTGTVGGLRLVRVGGQQSAVQTID